MSIYVGKSGTTPLLHITSGSEPLESINKPFPIYGSTTFISTGRYFTHHSTTIINSSNGSDSGSHSSLIYPRYRLNSTLRSMFENPTKTFILIFEDNLGKFYNYGEIAAVGITPSYAFDYDYLEKVISVSGNRSYIENKWSNSKLHFIIFNDYSFPVNGDIKINSKDIKLGNVSVMSRQYFSVSASQVNPYDKTYITESGNIQLLNSSIGSSEYEGVSFANDGIQGIRNGTLYDIFPAYKYNSTNYAPIIDVVVDSYSYTLPNTGADIFFINLTMSAESFPNDPNPPVGKMSFMMDTRYNGQYGIIYWESGASFGMYGVYHTGRTIRVVGCNFVSSPSDPFNQYSLPWTFMNSSFGLDVKLVSLKYASMF